MQKRPKVIQYYLLRSVFVFALAAVPYFMDAPSLSLLFVLIGMVMNFIRAIRDSFGDFEDTLTTEETDQDQDFTLEDRRETPGWTAVEIWSCSTRLMAEKLADFVESLVNEGQLVYMIPEEAGDIIPPEAAYTIRRSKGRNRSTKTWKYLLVEKGSQYLQPLVIRSAEFGDTFEIVIGLRVTDDMVINCQTLDVIACFWSLQKRKIDDRESVLSQWITKTGQEHCILCLHCDGMCIHGFATQACAPVLDRLLLAMGIEGKPPVRDTRLLKWPVDLSRLSPLQRRLVFFTYLFGVKSYNWRGIDGQLQNRHLFDLNEWDKYPELIDASRRCSKILCKRLGWSNDLFLPDDPFDIVFYDYRGDLDGIEADMAIEKEFGVTLEEPSLDDYANERMPYHEVLRKILERSGQDKK